MVFEYFKNFNNPRFFTQITQQLLQIELFIYDIKLRAKIKKNQLE